MSGLRQAIAMSLTWVAFVCYLKNKNLLFFIVTLFASLFHVSAIIFIFVLLLFKIKKTNYVLIASILSLILYFILGNQVIQNILNFILPGRFDGYIDRAEQSTFDVSIVTISLVLMLVLSMIFYNNFKSIKRNKIITGCMNLAIIGITFFIIGDSFPNMFRISYYFLIFLFPVFAEILNIVLEKKTYQIAYVALVLLLGFEYIYGGTGAGTEIYRFFWQ